MKLFPEQPELPRSPPRIQDLLRPLLLAIDPDFSARPDCEEVFVRLLTEGFYERHSDSFTEFVWRTTSPPAGSNRTLPYNHDALVHVGKVLKEILTSIAVFEPPEWATDWQEVTGLPLEVARDASTGNLLEGGYIVGRRANGTYYVEHTYGPEGREKKYVRPWDLFLVHRMDVPDDVYAELDWADETDPDRLAAGRDADPSVRAGEIANVGDTHGWDNIDHDPLRLTGHELHRRWEDEDWEERIAQEAFTHWRARPHESPR